MIGHVKIELKEDGDRNISSGISDIFFLHLWIILETQLESISVC